MDMHRRPTITEIVNHRYIYPYYYKTGLKVARFGRNVDLNDKVVISPAKNQHFIKKLWDKTTHSLKNKDFWSFSKKG